MFPGNRNKNILIKKLVEVKPEVREKDFDEPNSYLGNTIEEDYDTTTTTNSPSFILTKVEQLSQPKMDKKIVDSEKKSIDLLAKTSEYKYPIDTIIQTDYESLQLKQEQQIFLCAYHIDTENLKPYLTYLLYNTPDSVDNLFYFPFITYDSSIELAKQITQQFTSLTKFGAIPKLSGYLKNNGDYYFFLEFSEIDSEDRRDNNYVWSLIDELVNSKRIYNVNLHDSVSNLFYNNPDLVFLYDMEEIPHEIPSVVYTGDHINVSSFNSVFGKRKENHTITSLGNLYTFYDFETAQDKANQKSSDDDDLTEDTGGIVRYAVFAGKTKVFKKEELPELLQSESENNWSKHYHSAYIGKLTLQNGEKLADTPMLLTAKYDQQIPLTLLELNN